MTAQEAIQEALNNITLAAEQSDKDYPNDNMNLSGTLPITEIARCGFSIEVINNDDADTLPYLSVESDRGRLEIEGCPFAPLALLCDDGNWDGAEIVSILQNVGITTLKLNDFDGVPDWHGTPSVDWLFPERLSEALSLLDTLRQFRKP